MVSLRIFLLLLIAGILIPVLSHAATLQFLEDEGEGDFNLDGKLTVTDGAKLSVQMAFNYQDDSKKHYLLTVKKGLASIVVVSGDKSRPIGPQVAVTAKSGATIPFTVQRRQWRMALVWDREVVLRAYDPWLQDGKIGTLVTDGALADLRVQPVGEMMAEDDFVREEGAESIWQPILGNWEARTLRDDPQAGREEGDKSANAFSYFATGSPRAITVGGHWFWDRYSIESAVKAMGKGAVGVVLYYQDDKNYVVARWNSLAADEPNGNKLQLVAMRNGAEQVLAEREGGYEPGQWYKLRLQACDGVVQLVVDDELLLETNTGFFGQGQMGLYVEGKAGAFFDDVVCNEWELLRETFGQPVTGKWQGAGWVQKNGTMVYGGSGRALCAAGQRWERYTAALEVQPEASAGAGLAFCYNGATNYYVLRIASPAAKVPYAGKAQLVQFGEKGGNVLAEQPFKGKSGKHLLRVSVEDGLLTGQVGEGMRLQAMTPITGGGVAMYAEGRAVFDNLRLSLLPPRKSSHITKEFTESDEHPEMAAWASTKAPWVLPAEGKDEWWSRGDYFGAASVAFTIPAVGSKTGTARAVLGTEPEQKTGVALTVAATEKSKKLALAISAAEQELKKAEVEVEGDANIVFSRESKLIVVRVNDQPVLSVTR